MRFLYMKVTDMIISERIFKILEEKNMTQKFFADQVGIANSTVSEWKKKKTNPSADKIMDICRVLDITPEQLLTGEGIDEHDKNITQTEKMLIEDYRYMKQAQKKRLLAYVETLKKLEKLENI